MKTRQQTRLVATVKIERDGQRFKVSDDSGEFEPDIWDAIDQAYDGAYDRASELRNTPVDRRSGTRETYLATIEDHTGASVEIVETDDE